MPDSGSRYTEDMPRRYILGLVAALACAQTPSAEEVATAMRRIRVRVARDLNRLPNYTCVETIERSVQLPGSKRFELQDLVRLEVALVDNAEMFAWPGSREFQSRALRELVSGGAIGNGSFALHARSVFSSSAASVDFVGPATVEGRPAVEYRYNIPRARSTFILRHGDVEAPVGYGGSFFVDPNSDELMRLEVRANDIPEKLGIPAESEILDYQRVKLGDAAFLLPKASEMLMSTYDGATSRNKTTFSGCKQYSTESTLIFADPTDPEGLPALAAPNEVRDVPVGLKMDVKLVTPLVWTKSAVGDAVTALVRRDVKVDKRVVIPKGSQLKGRLLCLERRPDATGGSAYLVAVRFDELLANKWRGTVKTQLEEVLLMPELIMGRRSMRAQVSTPIIAGAHPSGQNVFVVYNEPRFTDGIDLVLSTQSAGGPSSESQKK
jgi:hypothetical protein